MKRIFLVCLTLLLTSYSLVPARAGVPPQDLPPRPEPARYVNDLAQLLLPAKAGVLDRKLRAYYDSTSTQVVVVIIKSLGPYEAADYAQQLGVRWGIGQHGKNNGLVILLAVQEHKVSIQTGYGLEATITDALTSRIIREDFQPFFQKGLYYEGLDAGTDAIIRAAAGQFKMPAPPWPWYKYVWTAVLAAGLGAVVLWVLYLLWGLLKLMFTAKGREKARNYRRRAAGQSSRYRSSDNSASDSGFAYVSGSDSSSSSSSSDSSNSDSSSSDSSFGGGDFGGGGSSDDW